MTATVLPRPQPRRRGTFAAALALALFTLVACGDDDPDGADAATTTSAPSTTAAPDTTTSSVTVGTTTARVYLLRGEKVAPVGRDVDAATPARGAMEALLAGPGTGSADLTSEVPTGTRLLDLAISDGVATVDLSSEFTSGGGSLSMRARVAQVVHTLTQFPTVESVAFRIDGEAVDAIGGEGVVVAPPRTRADVEDLAPAILLESPLPGERLTSPFTIEGTANTFEATYLVRLTDATGAVLFDGFGTATSGTGTRGTFSQEIRFTGAAPGTGVLRLFEESADDGSEIHAVDIPVEL